MTLSQKILQKCMALPENISPALLQSRNKVLVKRNEIFSTADKMKLSRNSFALIFIVTCTLTSSNAQLRKCGNETHPIIYSTSTQLFLCG